MVKYNLLAEATNLKIKEDTPMKVTLHILGRERIFSEQELIAMLEKHLSNEANKQITTAKVASRPTEGHLFEVNVQGIDRRLFQNQRIDERQEEARQLILEAFNEVKCNPEKYGKKFKTFMPYKTWEDKTIAELKQLACGLGDHNADWVEQALEWAQRISNGELWASVCNKQDTANWYRLIVWKDGGARAVGGSSVFECGFSASEVHCTDYSLNMNVASTVPLVVLYER